MKNKYLSYLFIVLAILLSDVMCATVAYNYCSMQWGIRYACYSAPASVALLLIIPYVVGIVPWLCFSTSGIAILCSNEQRPVLNRYIIY